MRPTSLLSAPRLVAPILALGLVFATPGSASASWFAMLPLVGQQISQAVDIWERHARMVEDHLDQVSGLANAYNDINRAYRTVRGTLSHLGIGERAPRLGDLYRAGFVNERCLTYNGAGNIADCALRDLTGGEFHRFEWQVRSLPGNLSGLQDFSTYEQALRNNWDGEFPELPSGPLGDRVNETILGVDAAVAPSMRLHAATARGRALFHQGRRRARRMAAAVDYGRRAATQMLEQPGRTGSVTDDFGGCGSVASSGMTVLVAAMRADCTRSTAGNGPRGSADGSANLSEEESQMISVQVQIAQTMLEASQLEQALLAYEGRLAARLEAVDMRREEQRRSRLRLSAAAGNVPGCVTYAYAAECAAGYIEVETPELDQARADLFSTTF